MDIHQMLSNLCSYFKVLENKVDSSTIEHLKPPFISRSKDEIIIASYYGWRDLANPVWKGTKTERSRRQKSLFAFLCSAFNVRVHVSQSKLIRCVPKRYHARIPMRNYHMELEGSVAILSSFTLITFSITFLWSHTCSVQVTYARVSSHLFDVLQATDFCTEEKTGGHRARGTETHVSWSGFIFVVFQNRTAGK